MILAQACMSTLLRWDDRVEQNGGRNSSPMSRYAAEHWVTHAQYDNVSSYLQKAMEYFFDLDKPYFGAWRQLHDIDTYSSMGSTFHRITPMTQADAVPLYYAALCGFQDLVEYLILKYPQHVNAKGGYYLTPLVAALAGEHFQTAKILRDNGADPNVNGYQQVTPLHSAAYYGHLQIVRILLEYKADVNAQNESGETPLHYLSNDFPSGPNVSQLHHVSRLLLEHGADINARSNDLSTPLHIAAVEGRTEVIRVLLEHGADVNARNKERSTALHLAVRRRRVEVVRLLLEHSASLDAEDTKGRTPFQVASLDGYSDIIELLSEHVPRKGM
jgi:ankyrin repeat protein